MNTRTLHRALGALVALAVLTVQPAIASFHFMQIEQVIGGVNGDATAQAIQLRMRSVGQNLVSQSRLRCWDAAGLNPILVHNIAANVANNAAGSRVLLATNAMLSQTTPVMVPDFIMTNPIPASYLAAGSLTFEDDFGTIYWRVSWGGAGYTGSFLVNVANDADGTTTPAFSGALPSATFQALQFRFAFNAASTNSANDYQVTAGPAVFTKNNNTMYTVTGPPTGACCKPDGTCETLTSGACAAASGLYRGNGSLCAGADCEHGVVQAGGDRFQCVSPSEIEFGPGAAFPPIPAGFFDPGSDPFTGLVSLRGLSPTSGIDTVDTVVRRLDSALLPNDGAMDTIPIEIVSLNLVSCAPIKVVINGADTFWDVAVNLQPAPQPIGSMTITRNDSNGGTFTSQFHVLPRFTFTRVNDSIPLVLDTVQFQLQTTSPEPWGYTPSPEGPPGGGPNFFPAADGIPMSMPDGRALVFDPAVLATFAKGACCFDNGTCQNKSESACQLLGGKWRGETTRCLGDVLPNNGVDDACEAIPCGMDLFTTPCGGGTLFDLCNDPIPADFFYPGSEPFMGIIILGGEPLTTFPMPGLFGDADTLVRRHARVAPDIGETETIPIELVALNLKSCNPITVTGGPDTLWDVTITLSPTPPPVGSMSITKTHTDGGTFDSQFFVQPLFIFTEVGNPSNVKVLDTGVEGVPPIVFEFFDRPWAITPPDLGIYVTPCAEGNFVPGVCTGDRAQRGATCSNTIGPIPYCGVNFFPGVQEPCAPPPDCIAPDNGAGTVEIEDILNCLDGYIGQELCDDDLAPCHADIAVELEDIFCVLDAFGGSLGGEICQATGTCSIELRGIDPPLPFQRLIQIQIQCETHIGPRTPGQPVQSFPNDIFFLQGQLPPGDPDFDLLRITAGTGFGMPSPGHTTLTQMGGNWAVDSFFDINYRIDFIGTPGGVLNGQSGSTTVHRRLSAGPEFRGVLRAIHAIGNPASARGIGCGPPAQHTSHSTLDPLAPALDSDNDGWIDLVDNCAAAANSDQADADGDGVGDLCDNCVNTVNPCQEDSDMNGIGDACAVPPCCLGNANKTPGVVNFGQVLTVLANFGSPANPNGTSVGDANCDGFINFLDILVILAQFGSICL